MECYVALAIFINVIMSLKHMKELCTSIVLYLFGPRNPEDIGQVNVQQYKPQNN
jgi:hypothetical protein